MTTVSGMHKGKPTVRDVRKCKIVIRPGLYGDADPVERRQIVVIVNPQASSLRAVIVCALPHRDMTCTDTGKAPLERGRINVWGVPLRASLLHIHIGACDMPLPDIIRLEVLEPATHTWESTVQVVTLHSNSRSRANFFLTNDPCRANGT